MKDTKVTQIENISCVRIVMKVTPVIIIEREYWGASSILRRVNDGVHICTYSVRSYECMCKTKHAFVYDSHFKPLRQSKFCGDIIDNRAYEPIFFMEDNDRGTKINSKHALKTLVGGLFTVVFV